MSAERRGTSGALGKASAMSFLPGVFWSGGRGDVSNKALEATADDALGLPVSARLLPPSVGGASVCRWLI